MKKYLDKIKVDYRDLYIYSSNYLREDTLDIKKSIRAKMSLTNCKRIFLVMPLFLFLDLYAMISMYMRRMQADFMMPIEGMEFVTTKQLLGCTQLLFLILIGYEAGLFQCIYRKEAASLNMRKCRLIYRSFWWIWGILMAVIAFGYLAITHRWWIYISVCLIICLFPLCTRRDFVASILGVCAVAVAVLCWAGYMSLTFKSIFYMALIIMVVGYIVQIFEVETWILREYIYINTFLDALTRHLNRKGGNALLKQELKKLNGHTTLGVIMLDVDFFKKYNDMLGHDEGDSCLKNVAESIRLAVGERSQIMIRHGGEEFVIILLETSKEDTLHWAEEIRKTVYERGIPAPHKEVADVVTVSVGATLIEVQDMIRYESVLKTADEALYEAKKTGRNRVVYHGE